jgi:hypothetical protein
MTAKRPTFRGDRRADAARIGRAILSRAQPGDVETSRFRFRRIARIVRATVAARPRRVKAFHRQGKQGIRDETWSE